MDTPAVIAQALYSPETLAKIRTIADTYKLHLDVIGDIEAFVNLRIADKISDAELISDIAIVVGDKALADKITADINTSIFAPLKEALKIAAPTPPMSRPMVATGPTTALPVVPPPAVVPTQDLLSEPKVPSLTIIEQKMPPLATPKPAESKPVIPPTPTKYHGTDPYREPVE